MSSDKNDNTNDKNTTRKETAKVANLKVAEVAEQRDVGRKIARIDPDIAERLNVSTGDALELSSLSKEKYCSKLACKGKRQRQRIDTH